jgi:hypothetical protein
MEKLSYFFAAVLNIVFCTLFMIITVSTAEGASHGSQQLSYLKPIVIVGPAATENSSNQLYNPLSSPSSVGLSAKTTRGVVALYQRACGETFRGLLVREFKAVVQVGIVVERSSKLCSALPVQEQIVLPVATRRAIEAFPANISERLTMVEAADVAVLKTGLAVSWQDTCRPIKGVLISPIINQGHVKLGVNLVQAPSDMGPPPPTAPCRYETRRIELTSINFAAQRIQRTTPPGQLESLYALGLRAPSSLHISAAGDLSITWEKTCQEKAVGALFSGTGGHEVAVVAVFSPNANCRDQKLTKDVYLVKGLKVANDQKLTTTTQDSLASTGQSVNFNFSLLPVSSIKLPRHGSGDTLAATPLAACSERLGLVVGEDSVGNLALAALAGTKEKICHASQSYTLNSLATPLTGPAAGPLPKIFGLRVFGTMIN